MGGMPSPYVPVSEPCLAPDCLDGLALPQAELGPCKDLLLAVEAPASASSLFIEGNSLSRQAVPMQYEDCFPRQSFFPHKVR